MSLNGESADQDICRDFLRNACTRGKNCKFKHPAAQDLKKYATDVGLPFCHDYQNRGCERPNCRYMHISRDEEKQIKETGIIPQHLISETSKTILHATDLGVMPGETPLCKDYQKGTCNRGMMCKFRHVDLTGQDYSAAAVAAAAAAAATGYAQYGATPEQQYYEGAVAPPQKRQLYDADYYNRIGGTATASYYRPAIATDYYNSSYYRLPGTAPVPAAAAAVVATTTSVADENKALREEVEKMKVQLAELRAANDLLLEQNARLRVTKEQTVTNAGPAVLTSVAEQTPVTTQELNPGISPAAGVSSGAELGENRQTDIDITATQTGAALGGGSSVTTSTLGEGTTDATSLGEQTGTIGASSATGYVNASSYGVVTDGSTDTEYKSVGSGLALPNSSAEATPSD